MRWLFGAGAVLALLWIAQFSARVAPLSAPVDVPAALAAFGQDPPVESAEAWAARRAPLLLEAFQDVYGASPQGSARVVSRQLIDGHAFGGAGRIEQLELSVTIDAQATPLTLVLVTPVSAMAEPAPVVVIPNFCGNPAAFGERYPTMIPPRWLASRCRSVASRTLVRALHGAHIVRPPFADLLKDGYAVATFSPAEIAPDDPERARSALQRFHVETGAVGVWAWSVTQVVDVLSREPAIDAERIALFGHSRFGKAALWAAALDMRVSLVIANQSGRLGASLSQSPTGERLSDLFSRFPHWFPESAPDAAAQLDQHLLLALLAPRPVLLGGARLDRWSDPAGAYSAARAASPVYELFGSPGLDQPDLATPNFEADIAVFLRDGGHGVRPSDWRMARAFLNAHFQPRT